MDLVQCSKQLIYKSPFYGHIALGLPKSFSNKIDTACAAVEGMNIALYFNEDFFNSLTDKQKVGLMEHELGHVCLFHLTNWDRFPNKEIFGIAADMTINQYIEADYLPPKGFLPSTFPELNLAPFRDTQYYYDELMKSQMGQTSELLRKLVEFMASGGKTSASHPLWGTDSATGEPIPESMGELIKAQIEHQMKQVYEETFNKQPGSIPGHLRDLLLSLYMKTPPVLDWRVVVRQFKSFCDKQTIKLTRTKPNKRFPEFDAVTLRQQRKMLVGIDTSGSISPDTLCEFFTQIGHMAKCGVEIDIAEWDACLQRVYQFNPRNPHSNMKALKGGGGTNPYEVVEYLNKSRNHNALVMLTDGYVGGEWTKKACKPILWIITAKGSKDFIFPGKKLIVSNLN